MACNIKQALALSVLVLMGLAPGAGGQPADAEHETGVVDAAQETAPEVDLGFLEFLGQWETDEGEWIPPSDLADENFAELLAGLVPPGSEESE